MSARHKPRKLKAKEVVVRPPKEYDTPGCCNKAGMMHWNGKYWCWEIEAGGPGMTREDCQLKVFFCPFCGTKLTDDMPVLRP
jgi:hypothetical protein